ncbi:glycoside hydrolase 5 family protein [Mycolicibacterium bacteremicum]|uniref:Beta-xylosidase n=1 Tax=Mycolicibacterium bacteremicum TaxID=564198 RepID=A0A1W9Z080_MYCBA|nr:beta-xylosidase [Mycolicibacterium bacteremicum]ORA05703.1 hypothetical protein BST17_07975 [Mycolicibacterium bacteremicum]
MRRLMKVVAALFSALVLLLVFAHPVLDIPHRLQCDASTASGRVGGSDGADMLTMSDAELDQTLVAARDAGMWAIRIDVDWSRVEPVAGKRDWAQVDRVVRSVHALGMCPFGIVTYAPAWAADPALRATGTYFAPADPAQFADFARTAAQRYRGSIAAWEVWNEPNTVKFFKPAPDPAVYGRLLAATYGAIKSVSRDIAVVSGGLAPAEDADGDIAPTTFLKALYAKGDNRYFDAFGIHPYSYPALPDEPGTGTWNTAQRLGAMYEIMRVGGDGGKQMWITECGAPTGTADTAVSENVQARTIEIMLTRARQTPWIGPAFVYSIRDSGTDPADPEQNFGILRHDFVPKQAYAVVASFGLRGDR